MKTLLLTCCICMALVSGCVNASYRNRTYTIVDGKPVLSGDKEIKYSSANVNIDAAGIDVSSPNDVRIIMGRRILVADPNSAVAIGHAIADALTGGGASMMENLTK